MSIAGADALICLPRANSATNSSLKVGTLVHAIPLHDIGTKLALCTAPIILSHNEVPSIVTESTKVPGSVMQDEARKLIEFQYDSTKPSKKSQKEKSFQSNNLMVKLNDKFERQRIFAGAFQSYVEFLRFARAVIAIFFSSLHLFSEINVIVYPCKHFEVF